LHEAAGDADVTAGDEVAGDLAGFVTPCLDGDPQSSRSAVDGEAELGDDPVGGGDPT
jgi:hypothetical protein